MGSGDVVFHTAHDITMNELSTTNKRQKKSGLLHTLDSWHREFDYVTACSLLEPLGEAHSKRYAVAIEISIEICKHSVTYYRNVGGSHGRYVLFLILLFTVLYVSFIPILWLLI